MRARVVALGLVLVTSGTATGAAARGPWVWPLDGTRVVSRAFAPPQTRYGPGHRGADLPGRPGQPVRAAGAGRISYAGPLAGRGVVVVVHGDLRTTYEPVTAAVRVGQQVTAGQLIGGLAGGHAGCTPACLHWGLLRGNVYLNPVSLIRRGPSRLLPLTGVSPPAPGAAGPSTGGTRAAPRAAAGPGAPVAARPDDAPVFALRAGDAASAGGALIALVAGLLLLRRPPRPPDRPVTPAVRRTPVAPEPPPALVGTELPSDLVDLAAERYRRRPEVA